MHPCLISTLAAFLVRSLSDSLTMVITCVWCENRITVKHPERNLRHEESCAEEPPPQKRRHRRLGVYVCNEPACQAKLLPVASDEVFQEWVLFHNTRHLITTLKQSGLTTQAAFKHLTSATDALAGIYSSQILLGMDKCYKEPQARQIYDPEFQDPAYYGAISHFTLALLTPALFWWSVWVLLVRFNRTLTSKLLQLW